MISRRRFLTQTVVVGGTVLSLSPSTRSSRIQPWSPPDDAITHSGGRYSWIVSDADDELDTLESWADGGENRRVIERTKHDATGTATVVARPKDIGIRARDRWSGGGLLDEEWVESVELNRRLTLAKPLTPESDDAWRGAGTIMSAHMSAFGGDLSPDGVAFDDDMEEAPIGDARDVIDADDATLDSVDTSEITLAVIDTGVNDGSVFEGRISDESWNPIDDETGIDAVADGDGHGTWVASFAAADHAESDYRGILDQADILALKALSDDGQGAIDEIAAAIRYAADEGADVLTLSLGSPIYSQAIEDALEYATDEGAIPVAAVGNDRQGTRWVATPASSEFAIGVASVTTDAPDEALSAYYSNTGPHNGITDDSGGRTLDAKPDVAAPGCELRAITPRKTGTTRERTLTGTSMATPGVAGVIGLHLADGGSSKIEDVRERIEETATPVPKAAEVEVGAGMASATALLDGEEPEETQSDAMTDEADARGTAYRQLSGSNTARLLAQAGLL